MIRSSILGQQTRKASESSSKQSIPSGPPPVWETAAQFFIPNTILMEVDECLQVDMDLHASASVEQGPNRDCDSHHDSVELGGQSEQDNEDVVEGAEDSGTSDQEGCGRAQDDEKDHRWKPPSIEAEKLTHMKIKDILHPKRQTGHDYRDLKLDLLLRSQLEAMQHFFWTYINPELDFYNKWMAVSLDTAQGSEWGVWFA